MSRVCELCGANVAQVMKGVGMDARIGPAFLQAGLGWGGSCLPKDVQGMISVARNWGYDFDLLRATVVVNQHQTAHFINRLENRLHGVSGKKIALLGLTFKPNTDDLRDSRSLIILESLLRNGALVTAYDPVANEAVKKLHPEAKYAKNAYEAAKDADAVIIATEWDEFKKLDLKKLADGMKQKIVFDGRLVYKREDVEAAGLEYFVVGERNVR
jgi:UDPglucose 6-dehydrogenase